MPDMVDQWAAALHRGLTLARIADDYGVDLLAVEGALRDRGLVCACGAVVGQENPGIMRGRNGACGYCLQERLGVKAASAII